MAASLVKVNGTEVSVEDSGRTVVNVNICQESSLAYLVKSVAAAGRKWPGQKAPAPKTPEPSATAPSPGRAPCTGEQKVLGGVQILLGVTCLGLGGVIFLLHDYLRVKGSGAPFWMGSLVLLATFFNLASVVAGCLGLAFGVADLPYLRYTPYWIDEACRREGGYGGGYRGYGGGYGSWRATRSPDNDWRVERCKNQMMNLL
ncbi:PREDICTED: transmembrane protein 176B-like, partial [Gekko japonicus]|uniref:Transmembrane protein 176B-like n=1 Tax=Gekko japonicus TaxID=146911 RepID=A0ABM1JPD7_GEKJA